MKLLTTLEVSKILQMHHESVRRKCRNDELPCVKIGNKWRVNEKELYKMIEEGKIK